MEVYSNAGHLEISDDHTIMNTEELSLIIGFYSHNSCSTRSNIIC
jgi:hypothetical protein